MRGFISYMFPPNISQKPKYKHRYSTVSLHPLTDFSHKPTHCQASPTFLPDWAGAHEASDTLNGIMVI